MSKVSGQIMERVNVASGYKNLHNFSVTWFQSLEEECSKCAILSKRMFQKFKAYRLF